MQAIDTASEQRLIERLRSGDEPAFEELVRITSGPLMATARHLMGREEDAQDALQDAYISAFRNISRFEGSARLTTWLHRILINACLMRLRSRKRRPEVAIETLLPTYLADGHQTRPNEPWVGPAAVEQKEVRELVRASIERLPEAFRIVLLLRDIEGLDTEEAAAMLKLSPANIKTRLHRARQALRQLLEPAFVKGAL